MTGCLLPALFASLQAGVVPSTLMVPDGLDYPAPPSSDKTVLGERFDFWLDTENFTIQWNDPTISVAKAEVTAEAFEEAWDRLVIDEGWEEPASALEHKLWIILDESMEGTGLTTGYPTATYPEGLPIIYLNTYYTYEANFFASLCTHEFAHALQFKRRDWYTGGEREAWFWEASSEWMAEIARPELDAYAYSSIWYAAAPDLPYFSTCDYHQYGMFLLNTFLDEYRIGPAGIREIWSGNTGESWLSEIERVTGEPIEETWAGFTGAYRAEAFNDSFIYEPPLEAVSPGEVSSPFGSEYISLGSVDGRISIDGGIGAVVRGGTWMVFDDIVEIPEGDEPVYLVVTNPYEEPLFYSYEILDAVTEDEPEGEDTGRLVDQSPADAEGETSQAKGCACSSGPNEHQWLWWSVGVCFLLGRRRRPE
jgi:MYXO-CTERM domain-containing protein